MIELFEPFFLGPSSMEKASLKFFKKFIWMMILSAVEQLQFVASLTKCIGIPWNMCISDIVEQSFQCGW